MYFEFTFQVSDPETQEIIIAELSSFPFEGFMENADSLSAYLAANDYTVEIADYLEQIGWNYNCHILKNSIKEQNWNAAWESSYPAVFIDDFCAIYADFHPIPKGSKYPVRINPRMSFGTGHHATTELVIRQMKSINFQGAQVFDFGSGTGILSLLASLLGAKKVYGLDNEFWAYENAVENRNLNGLTEDHIIFTHGSIEVLPEELSFDHILANINRHVLLDHAEILYNKLKSGGIFICSGILRDDEEIIRSVYSAKGFAHINTIQKENWISIAFQKTN